MVNTLYFFFFFFSGNKKDQTIPNMMHRRHKNKKFLIPVRLQNHGQRSVELMICYKRVITMNDHSDFNRYHI